MENIRYLDTIAELMIEIHENTSSIELEDWENHVEDECPLLSVGDRTELLDLIISKLREYEENAREYDEQKSLISNPNSKLAI